MAKKRSKTRATKYDQKLKVKGSLDDLLKELLHTARRDEGAKNALPKISGKKEQK